jgi:hypothetical protein
MAKGLSFERAVWLVAQSASETHWGKNLEDNNLFNFQGEGSQGHVKREYKEWDPLERRFKVRKVEHAAYGSPAESVQSHFKELASIWPGAHDVLTRQKNADILAFAGALGRGGYGTVGESYEDALVPTHRDVVSIMARSMEARIRALELAIKMAPSEEIDFRTAIRGYEAEIKQLRSRVLLIKGSVRFTDRELRERREKRGTADVAK